MLHASPGMGLNMRQLRANTHTASPKGGFGLPLEEPYIIAARAGLDVGRAKDLLERSFGKPLAEGYFDMPFEMAILERDYNGIAIIKRLDHEPYLDKFAVVPEAQGMGLARDLWKRIKNLCDSLVWRASPANPFNDWYSRNSDGSAEIGVWTVFWYGIEDRRAHELAEKAAGLPLTIIK